jgi:hypothetical protein
MGIIGARLTSERSVFAWCELYYVIFLSLRSFSLCNLVTNYLTALLLLVLLLLLLFLQVAHTYALYEGGYGIMNEHQVAIGESTCASKLWGTPVTAEGGKARIEVAEMSKVRKILTQCCSSSGSSSGSGSK